MCQCWALFQNVSWTGAGVQLGFKSFFYFVSTDCYQIPWLILTLRVCIIYVTKFLSKLYLDESRKSVVHKKALNDVESGIPLKQAIRFYAYRKYYLCRFF